MLSEEANHVFFLSNGFSVFQSILKKHGLKKTRVLLAAYATYLVRKTKKCNAQITLKSCIDF